MMGYRGGVAGQVNALWNGRGRVGLHQGLVGRLQRGIGTRSSGTGKSSVADFWHEFWLGTATSNSLGVRIEALFWLQAAIGIDDLVLPAVTGLQTYAFCLDVINTCHEAVSVSRRCTKAAAWPTSCSQLSSSRQRARPAR